MKRILLATALLTALPMVAEAQNTANDKPKPCSTEQYRHFDFWLGEWTVTNPKGKVVGHSKITRILGGCAISEAWSSATGYQGVSYNFYDQARQLWHQTWIGGGGGALYLDGTLQEGKMVLSGQTPNKTGGKTLQRITWTPLSDGRVSQHWQTSKDGGKTWQDAFMGYYSHQ